MLGAWIVLPGVVVEAHMILACKRILDWHMEKFTWQHVQQGIVG